MIRAKNDVFDFSRDKITFGYYLLYKDGQIDMKENMKMALTKKKDGKL